MKGTFHADKRHGYLANEELVSCQNVGRLFANQLSVPNKFSVFYVTRRKLLSNHQELVRNVAWYQMQINSTESLSAKI